MVPAGQTVMEELRHSFEALLQDQSFPDPSQSLQAADAYFLYRLLLGRSPALDSEMVAILRRDWTLRQFLTELLDSQEFSRCPGFLPPGKEMMSRTHGFRFWFDSGDREMGLPMALGIYEPATTRFLEQVVKPGMDCLDIGAQTGFFTCLMAARVGASGTVLAFEPMPRSYDLLCRNVMENGFGDSVTARQLACSDHNGSLVASMVSNMFVAGSVPNAATSEVEAVRVDDMVDGRVDLIKMDIEGHEPAALKGMERALRWRPIIISEANEYWLQHCSRSSAREYVRELASYGYDVYDIDHLEAALEVDALEYEENANVNLVALPHGSCPAPLLADPAS